jgi:prolyl-tRNA synthetase
MRRAALTMLSLRAARAFLRPAVSTVRRTAPVWSATESQQQQKPKKKKQQQKKQQKVQKGAATQASDSICSASEDFSQWYSDVIRQADMVDSSPVKGCMVIKPWGMAVWDGLKEALDKKIKRSGAENAYFPLLIPRSFLSKEAEHVDGFAKECAVVTHHRLKGDENGLIPDPDAELDEPLIIRPTSETIIWHMFQKWISSHRDLPLKINQWANVVRWEMRTRPFLRSSEFLWQEGHTAHATSEEAIATAEEMLDVYADVVENVLAVPVVKGKKSAIERFAGADETYTIEALMPNGWALQSGTSHFLGQNFARAFDVYYQTKEAKRDLVWATSWGVSTRLLGALVMTHSDDAGLVLPPAIAPVQVARGVLLYASSTPSTRLSPRR